MRGVRRVRLHTPKVGFTGGAGEAPSTPTDKLLAGSPRWEAACRSPLLAEVAERLRPPEALLAWVAQHNELARAFSALAESARRAAPAEHAGYLDAMASRLGEDARFAAEWATGLGGPEPAPAAPATLALLDFVAQIRETGSYRIRALGVWQWFTVQHHSWGSEVMLRRPASDLRRRFASQFDWEVVHPFRRELNRELRNSGRDEQVALQRVFDQLTGLFADWQTERAALAGPARPPGPLQPGQEALRAAGPGIAAMSRLLSISWNFMRALDEQVPDLPDGTGAADVAPRDRHLMVLLDGAFYRVDESEREGEPPLDELMLAIAAGAEATAGPAAHHPRWGDALLEDAPFEQGTEAWVWVTPSARVVLTSYEYDPHAPALALAFVLPPSRGPMVDRLAAAALWSRHVARRRRRS
jgi:hypothetical protein